MFNRKKEIISLFKIVQKLAGDLHYMEKKVIEMLQDTEEMELKIAKLEIAIKEKKNA